MTYKIFAFADYIHTVCVSKRYSKISVSFLKILLIP